MEMGGFILAAVVTLIAVVAVASIILIRGRKRVWEQFARRHGLAYERADTTTGVHGTVSGRPFCLSTPQDSSDVGPLGIQSVRMQIGLRGDLPTDTRISRAEGWVATVDRLAQAEAVTTGDEEFEALVLVESAEPEQVRAYLTPQRRALIRELVVDSGASDAGIDGAELFIQDREMLTDLKRIEQRLELMLKLAPGLDAV